MALELVSDDCDFTVSRVAPLELESHPYEESSEGEITEVFATLSFKAGLSPI